MPCAIILYLKHVFITICYTVISQYVWSFCFCVTKEVKPQLFHANVTSECSHLWIPFKNFEFAICYIHSSFYGNILYKFFINTLLSSHVFPLILYLHVLNLISENCEILLSSCFTVVHFVQYLKTLSLL